MFCSAKHLLLPKAVKFSLRGSRTLLKIFQIIPYPSGAKGENEGKLWAKKINLLLPPFADAREKEANFID
jgi:hypothetical protein